MYRVFVPAVALAACVLLSAAAPAQQAGHESHQAAPGPAAGSKMQGMMDQKCAMMQQKMDQMHQKMQGEHEKVQSLLRDINTTTGPAKMEAMAAAINAIAADCEKSHQMESDMMRAMMEHMSEHMAQGGGQSMTMCPMMQQHGEGGAEHGAQAAPAPQDEHSEHSDQPAPAKPDAEDHSAHHPNR